MILLIGFAFIVLGSCKGKKELVSSEDKAAASTNQLYNTLLSKTPDFSWFNGRARLKAETELAQIGATVQLRMRRDSLIWVRIEKFGFEMGRALFSPDSIWMVDRINREYYAMGFDSTLQSYGAPFSFIDLQDLLVGGTANVSPIRMSSIKEEEFTSLLVTGEKIFAQYWFDDKMDLRKGVLEDQIGGRVELENSDFRPVGNDILPFDKYLAMFGGGESAQLRIQFAEIELDVPQNLNFTIPDHYERVD